MLEKDSINQFKHREVRDLAWVIASPPLVSGVKSNVRWLDHSFCLKEVNDCLPHLLELDKNPQPLLDHLINTKSKRLGHRFEAFIAYWLQISPNYKLLAQNIQIIENKQTLGEIDFILQDLKSQRIIHLEVAVKFYLGTENFNDAYRWFGTNTQDQLGKKQQHLEQHQTQLSLKYPSHFEHTIDEPYCLLKGRLFYPFTGDAEHQISPDLVADKHLRGRWIRLEDLSKQDKITLYPIEKTEWLSNFSTAEILQKLKFNQSNFINNNKAQCCIQVEKDKLGKLRETNRIFVIPNDFEFPALPI